MKRVPDSHCALSVAATFLPHVVLNACLAALTARSTSSGVAWANDSCFLAVDGSTVSKVALSEAADHSLALEREGVSSTRRGRGVLLT